MRGKTKFMNKNNRILIIFGVIFVIGMIILMNSINLGDNELMSIMSAHGGSMDTNNYLIYLEQSIRKYKLIGLIVSILGVFGILKSIKTE